MEFEEFDQMYLNASDEVKKIVKQDIESGDKFAEEILALVTEDDSGIMDILAYPELRGLLSMVINNSEVLQVAMISNPAETARSLQLLMYSAIIFERQQVASKELIDRELQDILSKGNE